jgi:hypothetical protein
MASTSRQAHDDPNKVTMEPGNALAPISGGSSGGDGDNAGDDGGDDGDGDSG